MLRLELTYRGMVALGLAALTILALLNLWPVLLLLIVALIFMGALLPAVDWLVRRGVRRALAAVGIVLLIVMLLVALLALTLPTLIEQTQSVGRNLPGYVEEVEEQLRRRGANVDFQTRVREVDWARLILGSAVSYGQRAIVVLFSLFTIAVLTVYLLVDAPRLGHLARRLVPRDRRGDTGRILEALERVVGGYIRGQAITSASIAVFTFILLTVTGTPDPLAFALFAGFMDVVPLVGALIAIVPPVLAALDVSVTRALIVLGAMLAYQQFEDRFLVPRVYGSTLRLPPIVVLLAALAGAQLLGIVGVLLALPAAAAARVLLEYYLEERNPELLAPIPEEDDIPTATNP